MRPVMIGPVPTIRSQAFKVPCSTRQDRFGQHQQSFAAMFPLRKPSVPDETVIQVLKQVLPSLTAPFTLMTPAKDGGEIELANGEHGHLYLLPNTHQKAKTFIWRPEKPIKVGTKSIDELVVQQGKPIGHNFSDLLASLDAMLGTNGAPQPQGALTVQGNWGHGRVFSTTWSSEQANDWGVLKPVSSAFSQLYVKLHEAKMAWLKPYLEG